MNAPTWREGIRARLIDEIPSGVMVIDSSLNVVDHNHAFDCCFGEAGRSQMLLAHKGTGRTLRRLPRPRGLP